MGNQLKYFLVVFLYDGFNEFVPPRFAGLAPPWGVLPPSSGERQKGEAGSKLYISKSGAEDWVS